MQCISYLLYFIATGIYNSKEPHVFATPPQTRDIYSLQNVAPCEARYFCLDICSFRFLLCILFVNFFHNVKRTWKSTHQPNDAFWPNVLNVFYTSCCLCVHAKWQELSKQNSHIIKVFCWCAPKYLVYFIKYEEKVCARYIVFIFGISLVILGSLQLCK